MYISEEDEFCCKLFQFFRYHKEYYMMLRCLFGPSAHLPAFTLQASHSLLPPFGPHAVKRSEKEKIGFHSCKTLYKYSTFLVKDV